MLGVHAQTKVGHPQAQMTARVIHVAHAILPGAAAEGEARTVALTPDVPTITAAGANTDTGPGPRASWAP